MDDSQPTSNPTTSADVAKPIVVNLGKQSRKRIKGLKRNRGKLMDRVMETIAQVSGQLGASANGKVLVPVVVIFQRKRKRSPFGF